MQTVSKEKSKTINVKYWVRLAFLVALMIVMHVLGVGFITVGPLALTPFCIPVILGAVLLGPVASTFLGLIFGLSSFIFAFSDPTGLGQSLLALNGFLTFLALVGPRILMGLFTGLIFRLFNAIKKTKPVSHVIASMSATLLNSILFTTFLWLIFSEVLRQTYPSVWVFIWVGILLNALIELAACGLIGLVIGRIVLAVERRAEKKALATVPAANDTDMPAEFSGSDTPSDAANPNEL